MADCCMFGQQCACAHHDCKLTATQRAGGLFVQWSEPKLSFAASLGVDGLTESKAEELYARARSALGVTIPPPELQETYVQDWLAAARRAGVATPLGERAGDRNSESVNQVYADLKGRRRDSCTAYLLPLIAHGGRCAKNVKLIQNARARRVRLARKRAVGVEYVDAESGHKRFVRAKREVVSCAGPYGTPQLLQLSGIGPTELLRKYGIHVHKDLPVGKAAQARAIGIAASVYAGRPNAPENNETLVRAPETLAQFKAGKGGLLAVAPAATDGVYAGSGGGAGRGALTVTTWVVNSVLSAIPKDTPIFVVSCANNPESRATVQINGTDPETPPAVATNMLGTDDDAAEMVACLRYLNSIVQEMPPDFDFTQIAPEGGAPIDAAFVRATTGNAFHFTGAASVGTVLDAKLRVKGYENLRVIDAAAVPRIPDGAGPSSTVFVFAERGAELIIAAHKKSM